MNCKDEGRNFCMKQVNPNNSELHFGIAFSYNERFGECYLCRNLGLGRKYAFDSPTSFSETKLQLKRMVRP